MEDVLIKPSEAPASPGPHLALPSDLAAKGTGVSGKAATVALIGPDPVTIPASCV